VIAFLVAALLFGAALWLRGERNCQAISILHEGIQNAYERERQLPGPVHQESARGYKRQLDEWPSDCT